MDFLARQGFDFNKWVRSGIGYTSAASRDARLAALVSQTSQNDNDDTRTKNYLLMHA